MIRLFPQASLAATKTVADEQSLTIGAMQQRLDDMLVANDALRAQSDALRQDRSNQQDDERTLEAARLTLTEELQATLAATEVCLPYPPFDYIH